MRYKLKFWQLRTWNHDNLCNLTIKSDTDSIRNSLRNKFSLFHSLNILKQLTSKKLSSAQWRNVCLRKRFLGSVDQYVFAPPWNCAKPEFIISQPPLYSLPICFIEINEICSSYFLRFNHFMFILHLYPLYFGRSWWLFQYIWVLKDEESSLMYCIIVGVT